jgi:hypothetical protein
MDLIIAGLLEQGLQPDPLLCKAVVSHCQGPGPDAAPAMEKAMKRAVEKH